MKSVPFEMERWESTGEPSVAFDPSEREVKPLQLRKLLADGRVIDRSLDHPLGYSPGNGTPERGHVGPRHRKRLAQTDPVLRDLTGGTLPA